MSTSQYGNARYYGDTPPPPIQPWGGGAAGGAAAEAAAGWMGRLSKPQFPTTEGGNYILPSGSFNGGKSNRGSHNSNNWLNVGESDSNQGGSPPTPAPNTISTPTPSTPSTQAPVPTFVPTPMPSVPIPFAAGSSGVGGTSSTLTASILFIRHSESCANMLKRIGRAGIKGGYESNKYLDPELTGRGVKMANERGRQLLNLIPNILGAEGPLYYGASVLRRTQQTALELRKGLQQEIEQRLQSLPPNSPTNSSVKQQILVTVPVENTIHVLPYVSELTHVAGKTLGLDKDNTPVPASQRVYRPPAVSFDFADAELDGKTPNLDKFFAWLGHSPLLTPTPENQYATNYRMVIVTHGHWMKALAKELNAPQKYNNLEAAAVSAQYNGGGTLQGLSWLGGQKYLPYTPSPAVHMAICPDRCSRANICSGQDQGRSTCERLQALYAEQNPQTSTILDLAKDLKIQEAYNPTGPRPDVLQAIQKLGAYKSGFFTRKRNTRYLKGDLVQLMNAYNCGGASFTDEACQAIAAYTSLGPRAEQIAPNSLIQIIAQQTGNPNLQKYTRRSIWNRRSQSVRRAGLSQNVAQMAARCTQQPQQQPQQQQQQQPVIPPARQNVFEAQQAEALGQPINPSNTVRVQGGARRTRRRHHKKRTTHKKQ